MLTNINNIYKMNNHTTLQEYNNKILWIPRWILKHNKCKTNNNVVQFYHIINEYYHRVQTIDMLLTIINYTTYTSNEVPTKSYLLPYYYNIPQNFNIDNLHSIISNLINYNIISTNYLMKYKIMIIDNNHKQYLINFYLNHAYLHPQQS